VVGAAEDRPARVRRWEDTVKRTELGQRSGSFARGIAVEGKRTIYVSGHVGIDGSGQVVSKVDLGAQTRQTFENIEAVAVVD
jgi:enamine deaminase RidA (YjgF/YER057c/UK114 family)